MPNSLATKIGFRVEFSQEKSWGQYTHMVAAIVPRSNAPKVFSRVTFIFRSPLSLSSLECGEASGGLGRNRKAKRERGDALNVPLCGQNPSVQFRLAVILRRRIS